MAEQHLCGDAPASVTSADSKLATESCCFMYRTGNPYSAALYDIHRTDDYDRVRRAVFEMDINAIRQIDLKEPAFFNLAYDYLLLDSDIPPALGALLLTYAKYRHPYTKLLRSIADCLPKEAEDYYRYALEKLMLSYRKYYGTGKARIPYMLWLSSRKLTPVRRGCIVKESTTAIKKVWADLKRMARVSGIVYRPERIASALDDADYRLHTTLSTYFGESALQADEAATRLLAFNRYALSRAETPYSGEPRMVLDFTEQGEFTFAFEHLKQDGGIPLKELVCLVERGLLIREEADDENETDP